MYGIIPFTDEKKNIWMSYSIRGLQRDWDRNG
jgi:hypothetical protein